jgi:hypothetical protein
MYCQPYFQKTNWTQQRMLFENLVERLCYDPEGGCSLHKLCILLERPRICMRAWFCRRGTPVAITSVGGGETLPSDSIPRSVCIASSIGAISASALRGFMNLQQLAFDGASVVSIIQTAAFSSCSSLRSICIPSSVTTLGQSCFGSCSSLQVVFFEPVCRISCIPGLAFSHCSGLAWISIPESVEFVDGYSFYSCGRLCVVDFTATSRFHRSAFVQCDRLGETID